MPELMRLNAGHAPAVLAFELANRAYFAASVSDRGEEYFEQFADRHSALLAEQEAGIGAFYVLVAEDGSVLGRFNLYRFRTALPNSDTGLRSTLQAEAWRPRLSGSCAGWRRRGTDCGDCGRPPPARMLHHSGYRSRLDSSRPTRPTRAVSRARGISATWCSAHWP
ncbi:hypothetical protein GCM10009727_14880 [Actinomadura napierensis]|uniref:GNAT family N-acetyltransferase n=1 Tax=Actinomadura napierensis TaxID=267854 RepID=A0ABN2YFI3_9ACTN